MHHPPDYGPDTVVVMFLLALLAFCCLGALIGGSL